MKKRNKKKGIDFRFFFRRTSSAFIAPFQILFIVSWILKSQIEQGIRRKCLSSHCRFSSTVKNIAINRMAHRFFYPSSSLIPLVVSSLARSDLTYFRFSSVVCFYFVCLRPNTKWLWQVQRKRHSLSPFHHVHCSYDYFVLVLFLLLFIVHLFTKRQYIFVHSKAILLSPTFVAC